MEEINNEFITKHKTQRKPYTTSVRADGTKVVTFDMKRLKPADKVEIEMLVNAGYMPVRKRPDITKADMIKYVKENYEQEELNLLENKIESINTPNPEDSTKNITFATVKSWFKQRYIYYPKGLKYNFGNNAKSQEKKERFLKVFVEHKENLKNDWIKPAEEPKEEAKEQETSNKNKNKNKND